MSNPQDDLLLSLQSSLRNTLHTFGPDSAQYQSVKYMVEEHIAKTAVLAEQQEQKQQQQQNSARQTSASKEKEGKGEEEGVGIGSGDGSGNRDGSGSGRVMNLAFRPRGR
ncbi:hypothetical protein BDV96DRAFT_565941 [Lophiotrema nucula]|uniref:Uncharacterized protein n=1 Tax=Lophiotrema nucula TaxID=690887 RepID=A0A6A5ZMN7_9PLEO|nr:hypothetical protein BDV96DRAFT_565941 [Lophiotrema nucula]